MFRATKCQIKKKRGKGQCAFVLTVVEGKERDHAVIEIKSQVELLAEEKTL